MLIAAPAISLILHRQFIWFSAEQQAVLARAAPFAQVESFDVIIGQAYLSTRDLFFLLSNMPRLETLSVRAGHFTPEPPWLTGPADPRAERKNWSVRDAGELPALPFKLREFSCWGAFEGWHLPALCSAGALRSLTVRLPLAPVELRLLDAVWPGLRTLYISDTEITDDLCNALSACASLRTLALPQLGAVTVGGALSLFDALVRAGCRLQQLTLGTRTSGQLDLVLVFTQWRALELSPSVRSLRALNIYPIGESLWTSEAGIAELAAFREFSSFCAARKILLRHNVPL
ncbi:hypothetical protein AURDEDRAFT_113675 [Auricularia subglabra TFB-10046 SS5]|nr:hypothetical protein AURDEDRAFT_113675 [Auricularia subglabra TFB-10046 SS5]